MPTNQKGIVQAIVLLILVAGLGAGLYLSQKTQIFKPKAFWRQPISAPVTPKPSKSPHPSQCSNRVAQFTLGGPCNSVENGFYKASFSCSDNPNIVSLGDPGKCEPGGKWFSMARRECRKSCPTPSSTPQPTPANGCINDGQCPSGYFCQQWACAAGGGGCIPGKCVPNASPTPKPTPDTRSCLAVITPAINIKTGECKDFPTPCDVPPEWKIVIPHIASCSSFKEGQFCGGVTGTPCPSGYTCKLESPYPDAGGTCVKS